MTDCQFCRAGYVCHEHTVGTDNVKITKLKAVKPEPRKGGPELMRREEATRQFLNQDSE